MDEPINLAEYNTNFYFGLQNQTNNGMPAKVDSRYGTFSLYAVKHIMQEG